MAGGFLGMVRNHGDLVLNHHGFLHQFDGNPPSIQWFYPKSQRIAHKLLPTEQTLRQARRVVDLRHALLAAGPCATWRAWCWSAPKCGLRFHHLWIFWRRSPKVLKNVDLILQLENKNQKIWKSEKKGEAPELRRLIMLAKIGGEEPVNQSKHRPESTIESVRFHL